MSLRDSQVPHSDLPQIHPSAFVDPTAMLCGLMIIEELVLGYQHIQNQLGGMDSATRPRPHRE